MPRRPTNPMPRTLLIVALLLAAIIGALFLLSSNASEVPTRQIEVDVAPAGNAG